MTSQGDFQLFWYDVRAERELFQPDQFVFESVVECAPSLSRVRSARDLFELLSGGDKEATTKVVVAVLALLGGNLIARGQWAAFFSCVGIFLTVAVFQLQAVARTAAVLLVGHFFKTLWDGLVSFEWLITVLAIVVLAVFIVMVIRITLREDPRSYVLLKERCEEEGEEGVANVALIRNECCMDVKVLSFEANDNVQFVPRGGLLPRGSIVPRGGHIQLGTEPPYSVKIFAPFETELGTWTGVKGHFILRATAPPAIITPSAKTPNGSGHTSTFRNSTEADVVMCICNHSHWTSSLWLPLSQAIARLYWPGRQIKPSEEVEILGPCVVRVYTGFVNVFGAVGGVLEQACCMIRAGEDVDFVGGITWSRPLDRARNSMQAMSSLLSFRR